MELTLHVLGIVYFTMGILHYSILLKERMDKRKDVQ